MEQYKKRSIDKIMKEYQKMIINKTEIMKYIEGKESPRTKNEWDVMKDIVDSELKKLFE